MAVETDSKRDLLINAARNGNEGIARELIKDGALVDITDRTKEETAATVLSYFIHNCINNGMSSQKLYELFAYLAENAGVKEITIAREIIDAIFCKLPLLVEGHFGKRCIYNVSDLLDFAVEFSKKAGLNIDRIDSTYRLFNDIIKNSKVSPYVTIDDLFTLLQNLIELDAQPNASDEQKNTILHYISLLAIYDYNDERKTAFDIIFWLEAKGSEINKKNCDGETPLLYMLSSAANPNGRKLDMECILNVCRFFFRKEPMIAMETSQKSGESVFHVIIKLFNVTGIQGESTEQRTFELLQICLPPVTEKGVMTVNKSDNESNTPLHIWAALPPEANSRTKVASEGRSKKILDHLLSCGAVLHMKNLKGETALHVCRTWNAIKLLVKAGAVATDVDLNGRSPLLSAAQKFLFLKNRGCFYPDVLLSELPTFWKEAMEMGFELWSCDKDGDSIISNLVRGKSFELSDALIGIACDDRKGLSDETLVSVLNVICRDNSTQTAWKAKGILVGKLLRSIERPLDLDAALQACCMNIKDNYVCTERGNEDTAESDSIHYQIAKQLCISGASSASCLQIAEGCPRLQALLSTPIRIDDVPLIISAWKSVSKRYENILAEVARRRNCKVQAQYWYHKSYIGIGAFSYIFAGINKSGGNEVAIKVTPKYRIDRPEDKNEVLTLTHLSHCTKIVQYLSFLETDDFSYIILELMEGNLNEYFGCTFYDSSKSKALCEDIVMGLNYLHEQNIIHRDLKPSNILYKTHPQLCLKIADFGLSRRVDVNASFTVMDIGVGTRGWIAPEVMKSTANEHSTSSDIFLCGLVFHYILSKDHRHPFSPADCTAKSELEIIPKTETNIMNNNMEGWDSGLDPEASHVITGMLNCTNEKERPTASMLLHHPMFWSKKKKLDFLSAVGNQEEFVCPRAKRTVPLTMVEQDLEKEFATIVRSWTWDNPRYKQTWPIFIEMQKPIVKRDKKGKPFMVPTRKYDIGSAVELVRFIRNAISRVSEVDTLSAFSRQILEDAVFLDEFPNLVIEVFKAVTEHGWDVSREEIKYVLLSDIPNRERLLPIQYLDEPLVIRCWKSNSKRYNDILHRVARRQNCKLQGSYRYYREPIAEGAFGYVFVGIHKKDGREVAIKRVSNLKLNRNRDSPRSREVITLSSLSSLPVCEHIVRYIDYITNEDFSFIIMELMEGNLIECFASDCFDQREIKKLCRDVALGLKYLHEHEIVHRDLNPRNILFKTHPKLSLKIADFGLSRRLNLSASFTVMNEGCYGTRVWVAPEVIESAEYSPSSDVFSLGLTLHYILSNQSHPFDTVGCTGKITMDMINKTENNIKGDKKVGWNEDLDPEASDLLLEMICADKKQRPTASSLLDHPMFWTKTKKLDFLCGVGNQEEFECPRTKKTVPLTMVEQDLENVFGTIVKSGSWDDTRYPKTSVILSEMKKTRTRSDGTKKAGRKDYNCGSAVELVRLIRNAKAHVSEPSIPAAIKKQILEAVFLDEFPNLVIEVFKAVTKHTWDVREEIKYDLAR